MNRYIIIVLAAISILGTALVYFQEPLSTTAANYYIQDGNKLLAMERYEEALTSFNIALKQQTSSSGALLGRALVFINQEKYNIAEKELTLLIELLTIASTPDSNEKTNILSSAFANRGIIKDRKGTYKAAFDDYVTALKTKAGITNLDKVLSENSMPSTLRERAIYLKKQIELPPGMRTLIVPKVQNN